MNYVKISEIYQWFRPRSDLPLYFNPDYDYYVEPKDREDNERLFTDPEYYSLPEISKWLFEIEFLNIYKLYYSKEVKKLLLGFTNNDDDSYINFLYFLENNNLESEFRKYEKNSQVKIASQWCEDNGIPYTLKGL